MLCWRPGLVARNTVHAGAWNLVRIGLQGISLIVLARVLGANGYGALAGSMALFMTMGQFTGLGSGVALVRHIARQGEVSGRFTATMRAHVVSGFLLFLIAVPASFVLLQNAMSPVALGLLAAAEIFIVPVLHPVVCRYQAEERMGLSSLVGTLAPVMRLSAAITMVLIGLSDLEQFAVLYIAWLTPAVLCALWCAWPRTASRRIEEMSAERAIRDGLPYAVSAVAMTAGSELDKTVLLRIAGDAVTGPYAAAYRIASAAIQPVNALILAAAPRLFRRSRSGSHQLPGVMFIAIVAYAVVAAMVLWLFSPFVPWLLGTDFSFAQSLLRVMCVVVITGSLRQYVSVLLTTCDRQGSRNLIEIGGMILSLILLLILVPRYGAYGAIAALAISDLGVIAAGTKVLRARRVTTLKDNHA